MINFTASFIHNTTIKKKNNTDLKYYPYEVSLVEINPADRRDLKALEELSFDWGEYSYAGEIYENMKLNLERRYETPNTRTLAVTTQKNRFEKLAPEKILGIAQYTKKGDSFVRLNFLETNPQETFYSNEKKFKNIGQTMLNEVKSISKANKITLHSTTGAKGFYKKLGFVENPEIKDIYNCKSKYDLIWLA